MGDYARADDRAHALYHLAKPACDPSVDGGLCVGHSRTQAARGRPDVGGGFGTKIFHYPEEAFCTFAAKACNRPVKWTSAGPRRSCRTPMAATT